MMIDKETKEMVIQCYDNGHGLTEAEFYLVLEHYQEIKTLLLFNGSKYQAFIEQLDEEIAKLKYLINDLLS